MTLEEILKSSKEFKYQLLGRMQADCKYYLGYGGRQKSRLWALDEGDQIAYMKAIWNSFAEDEKPEGLTWEQILDYEHTMILNREVKA